MKLLLDTATFIWLLEDAPELSSAARTAIADMDNDVYLSAASAWEIAVKYGRGRLQLPRPPEELVREQREARGFIPLPIDEASALRVHHLPALHADPFDRILACQAIEHAMTVVTPDALLRAYPIRTIW